MKPRSSQKQDQRGMGSMLYAHHLAKPASRVETVTRNCHELDWEEVLRRTFPRKSFAGMAY
eukprot:1366313-Amphidinium_carterae.1